MTVGLISVGKVFIINFIMRNGEYILVIAPDNYTGKRYRKKYCYEHHLVYWQNTGHILSKGEVIHHKDGNKHNNVFENLELINVEEHSSLHGKNVLTNLVKLKCPGCGKIFIKPKRLTHLVRKNYNVTCCSRKCIGKFTSLDSKKQESAILENVICEFRGIYKNK